MLRVGLTGGIASGKSTVAELFSQYSIPVIDADLIARRLVEQGQAAFEEIVQTFGNQVLDINGSLNRQILRQLIFSDTVAKQKLETILHPKIRQQLLQQSQACNAIYCILAIPLLFEANMTDLADRVLVVDVEPALQLERLCRRDDISEKQAHNIIKNQCDRQQRLAIGDDVIVNDSSIDSLKQCVDKLHQSYLSLAKTSAISCQHSDSHGQ
ncbi:MAG: dephospho-CoA kinase [Gammaproteobacteria bacterium]|nr:MAG: dephospho-CoA kinase [Gammaproteobacteria bacterium]RKZ98866.1 MAG: dephospho-CoA kinase [Gammaproteobacteria bacterium]